MDSHLWAFVLVATLLAVTPRRRHAARRPERADPRSPRRPRDDRRLGAQLRGSWLRLEARAPRSAEAGPADRPRAVRRPRSLLEGLLTNVLNPKVGIFYLPFLRQFIAPGDPALTRSLLLAGLHIGIGVAWLSTVAFGVGRIRPLVESRLWRARLEGASGTVQIGLGVRLAAERR